MNRFQINTCKQKVSRSRLSSMKGFTLIEVMISMLLGGIVMGTALYTMQSTIRVSNESMTVSRVESTGRLALKHLKRHIEMTGFIGCADSTKIKLKDNSNVIPNTPDGFMKGFNNYKGQTNAVANTDAIRIVSGTSTQDELSKNMTALGGKIETVKTSLGLKVGDHAIISSCEKADAFKVNTINPIRPAKALSNMYTTGVTRVLRLIDYTYYVGDTNRKDSRGNPVYALYRVDSSNNREEIIAGIENFQVLYGIKDNSGNVVFEDASGTTEYDSVQLIRISLVASAESQDHETGNQTFSVQDGKIVLGGSDIEYKTPGRIRRSFNGTFVIRGRIQY